MKRTLEPTLTEFLKMHYIKYQVEGDQILLEKGRFCKGVASGPYIKIKHEIFHFIENPPKYAMMLASLPVDTVVHDAQEAFASQTIGTFQKFDCKLRWTICEQKLTGCFIEVSGTLSKRIEELLCTKLHFEIGNKFILCCEKDVDTQGSFKNDLADNIEFVREVDISNYKLVNKTPLNGHELKSLLKPTVKEFLDIKKIDYIPVKLNLNIGNGPKLILPFECLGYCANQDFLYKKEDSEMKRKYNACRALIRQYVFLAHATLFWFIIDIDCRDISEEVKSWLLKYPYYKSSTKPYGYHILVTSKFKPTKRKYDFLQRYGSKIELLCGLWSFAPKDGVVYNADASTDMDISEDMLVNKRATFTEHVPSKPHDYEKIQSRIVDYLQKEKILWNRNIEFLEFYPYDEVKQIWQIRIRSCIEGFCPCKNDYANNNHNASICIDPKRVWMRCYRNQEDSDCQNNALRWNLPKEHSKQFFPHLHCEFFDIYGIYPEELKYSPGWLAQRFLYSNKHRYVLHRKTLYVRDAYGIFQKSSTNILGVVLQHFELLKIVCDLNIKEGKDRSELESEKIVKVLNGDMTMVLNHIRSSITDHLFMERLDKNPRLLAFKNGILNLDDIDAGVRNATNTEYFMQKCRYNYERTDVEALKEKIIPLFDSEEEMNFRLTYAAMCLGSSEEMILFETGPAHVLRFVEEVVFGDNMAAMSPDVFLKRKTQARKEKCIDIHSARKARLWVCNHLEGELDRTQLNNFILRLSSRKRLNHDNDMVTVRAPPIIISLLGSPCLPYLPGLCIIRYNRVKHASALKDELAAKPVAYMNLLLNYWKSYMEHGINVPSSIKELSNRSIMENFRSWLEYYFEISDEHVEKRSIHNMYTETVGEITPSAFSKLLKTSGLEIGRGLYGKKLQKKGGQWGESVAQKVTVVKHLKLNY